jgi:hypothetical protein
MRALQDLELNARLKLFILHVFENCFNEKTTTVPLLGVDG